MMTQDHIRVLPRFLLISACAALFPWASGLAAEPEAWRAASVEGEATVQDGERPPVPIVAGSALGNGHRLATGPAGRVVLARGATTITVGPNGRMEIPVGGDDGQRTKVLQTLGSLLFKVEKRASQHFEVETPYLAAVVKGTTFTVSADSEASAVHVVEGAVEVTALATGQVGLVKPGFTAVVSPRRGNALSIIGGKPKASRERGQTAQAGEDLDEESAAADQAAGSLAAPGQIKRLQVTLGQPTVDVEKSSKGFVKNANFAGTAGTSTAGTSSAGGSKVGGGKDDEEDASTE